MSKWLGASALALLLALPAFAQSSDRAPSQAIESAGPKASGDSTPSAAAESKTSGQPVDSANSAGSGASGTTRPADRGVGAAKPDESSADAYKKDFEKK